MSDGNLWERQSGETAKAYAAFLLYRDLPAIDRSVSAARERHQRGTKGTPKGHSANGRVGVCAMAG